MENISPSDEELCNTDKHLLPTDFDAKTYLLLNPDVKEAGVQAEVHYLQYGLLEKK